MLSREKDTLCGVWTLFSGSDSTPAGGTKEVRAWRMPEESAATLEVSAVGYEKNNRNAASYKRRATFFRKTGDATQVGTTTDVETTETVGVTSWNVTITKSGATLSVSLVGGSDPIAWVVEVRLLLARRDP